MKYRVILAFETYSVGQVIEPTGLWADSLKQRGYIEPIAEELPRVQQRPVVHDELQYPPKKQKKNVHRV